MKYALPIVLLFVFTHLKCTQEESDTGLNGEELANIHCSSCHQLPKPGELDTKTWKDYMLPRMGYFLGFREDLGNNEAYFDDIPVGEKRAKESKYFVNDKPVISTGDWKKIQDYYLDYSPDSLAGNPQIKAELLTDWFETKLPIMGFSPPGTSLTHFSESGNILIADIHKEVLLQFDLNLDLKKQDQIGVGGVKFVETETDFWLAVMGAFEATDAPMGSIVRYAKNGNKSKSIAIIDLQRPVDFVIADLNANGKEDLVICEFGKYSGGLSFFSQNGDEYVKKYLSQKPGATVVKLVDWDNDGDKDLIVLYGQAEEGIYYYENDGKANFKESKLLSFPATYGSIHIDIVDIDKDGDEDIVYSCGDNADYPAILKPYHGVRILKQTAPLTFAEEVFLPLNGAYKSIAGDFDNDGILDIAAISFFPNYEYNALQYFTLFKGKENDVYEPYELAKDNLGRFCTMDVKDVDKDGDLDIVLGSLSFEVMPRAMRYLEEEWAADAIPFVYLENKTLE